VLRIGQHFSRAIDFRILRFVDRPLASERLIECCGETLAAAAARLATEPFDPLAVTSALYALANAAEGALTLVDVAGAEREANRAVDVDIVGLDALFRAQSAIEQICSMIEFFPIEGTRS
jgi:hypothetical protein